MFNTGRIHRMSLLTVSTGVDGLRKKELDLGHGSDAIIEVSDGPNGNTKMTGILFHPEERDRGQEWFIGEDSRILERDCSAVSPGGMVEWRLSQKKALETTDIGPPAYI